uniref:Uncharacterized protein n=1 Tax=Anguilla anguilla TaxID=7936 RepID=A0A0E9PUE5_ANGAN
MQTQGRTNRKAPSRTHNLPAVRQQCDPLHHRAALLSIDVSV